MNPLATTLYEQIIIVSKEHDAEPQEILLALRDVNEAVKNFVILWEKKKELFDKYVQTCNDPEINQRLTDVENGKMEAEQFAELHPQAAIIIGEAISILQDSKESSEQANLN